MTYRIRDAVHADLPAICDIYNDAVLNTTAIWNEQAVDLGNRQAWFSARQSQAYPILVVVDSENSVLGYASFGDWRPFDGFRHTVEHSVYVRSDQRGNGLGPRLMEALVERAKGCGKHVMGGFNTYGKRSQGGNKLRRVAGPDVQATDPQPRRAAARHQPGVIPDERRPTATRQR